MDVYCTMNSDYNIICVEIFVTDQTSYNVTTAGEDVNTSMISLHVVYRLDHCTLYCVCRCVY